jgi:hypothetical protein
MRQDAVFTSREYIAWIKSETLSVSSKTQYGCTVLVCSCERYSHQLAPSLMLSKGRAQENSI